MKLTDWFPKDTKPALTGVYEVKSAYGTGLTYYSYWDGFKFRWRDKNSPEMAFENRNEHTGAPPTAEWRGLAEDPNGSKP